MTNLPAAGGGGVAAAAMSAVRGIDVGGVVASVGASTALGGRGVATAHVPKWVGETTRAEERTSERKKVRSEKIGKKLFSRAVVVSCA